MTDLDLTVVVPSIIERENQHRAALASIDEQTVSVKRLTLVDFERNGPAETVNTLAGIVETEWLFRLDDDDLLDPDHFEIMSHWLDDTDADIVYTWCRIEGGGEDNPEAQFQVNWQADFGWDHLNTTNWIPCSAAIRTSLWRELGGLRDVPMEDWDLWKRALAHGAKFLCIPTVTWTYRMNSEWEHRLPADIEALGATA